MTQAQAVLKGRSRPDSTDGLTDQEETTENIDIAIWQAYAQSYEKFVTADPGYKHMLQEATQALDLDEGDTVLDIGCGTGNALDLMTKDMDIGGVGLDISRAMLENAGAKLPDNQGSSLLTEGDMTRIPLADGTVHACLSINSLYPLVPKEGSNRYESLETTIREVQRVLTQDGIFVASVPHPTFAEYSNLLGSIAEHFSYFIRNADFKGLAADLLHIFGNLKRARQVFQINRRITQIYELPTTEKYIDVLTRNGFRIEETRDVPTGNTLIVARKIKDAS